jgi:hypothetical protein
MNSKTKNTLLLLRLPCKNKISLLFSFFCFLPFCFFAQTDPTTLEVPVKTELEEVKESVAHNAGEIKKLKKLRISGYIQAQFEVGQEFAETKVGSVRTYDKNRDGKSGDFFRFGIRRGRIRFTWEESFGSAVFQLDVTERGVSFRDAFIKISEPWLKVASFTTGVFFRPFGDELSYSSARRESPERTVLYQELFPDERDLGAMITLVTPKGSVVEGLKLDAGAFCGNGIAVPDNGKMDFIGHLKYDKKWSNVTFGIGASMYYGTVRNIDTFLYKIEDYKWLREDVEKNQKNIRQYYGFDAQFSVQTLWGISNIRAEVLFGTQPSTAGRFRSPNRDLMQFGAVPFNHIRKFWGAHAYFVQDIYKTPLTLALRYSYMDPNTQIGSEEIKSKTDLSYNYLGFGLLVRCTPNLRLMCYYEMPFNSKNNKIPVIELDTKINPLNYQEHVKEGVFTCRLQYRF